MQEVADMDAEVEPAHGSKPKKNKKKAAGETEPIIQEANTQQDILHKINPLTNESLPNQCVEQCIHNCTEGLNSTIPQIVDCLGNCNCEITTTQLFQSKLEIKHRFKYNFTQSNRKTKVGIFLPNILYYGISNSRSYWRL